ncbi:MAG: hypothetical protein WBA39_28380 [Rivularia sp. (in: cyanobacteria)]
MPLLISVASPSFDQNSISQSNNRLDTYKEVLNKHPKRQKDHRGSGRRSYGGR